MANALQRIKRQSIDYSRFFHIRFEDNTSPEYKNCFCVQHVKVGIAKLEYDDPDITGNTVTLILLIFENTAECSVNEKSGTNDVGM